MKPNYTRHHLQLFIGIDIQCKGASTWILHEKKEVLTPSFMKTLMEDDAIDWVKPILRPLKAITRDEAIHIAKLALDIKEYQITNMTAFTVHDNIEGEIRIKAHYYDTLLERYDDDTVTIDESFDVWHNQELSVFNQPHIFQYLIQQQFDVFGWIKSEIALDKSKIL